MNVTANTNKGIIRDMNQDYYCVMPLNENAVFAVVCDGMGGANAGNIASKTAAEKICQHIKRSWRPSMSSNAVENLMRSALESANSQVYLMAKSDDELKGMGTTVVMAYIENEQGYILHVGDSRAYIFENKKLTQLTVDHSMVQTLVDSGQISAEEAKIHPKKNIITRALGVGEEVVADLDFFTLTSNQVLMLCSDGLTNFLSDEDIIEQLENCDKTVADRLIEKANQNGGGDNITVAVITQ